MPDSTSLKSIESFLASSPIAAIGVSRNEKDFGRGLYRELIKRGIDVKPVHPQATEIDGRACVASVGQLDPVPEAAIVMTSSQALDNIVKDCIAAGVKRVWLLRDMGDKKLRTKAVNALRGAGIEVIDGKCPDMFLEGSGFPHNFHAILTKLFRAYPK
jgi:predicted CoA-binding protein